MRLLVRDGKKPGGRFREASWDEAVDLVARQCRQVCDKFTSGAVGIYNSGQLFIEDYYTLSVASHTGLGAKHLDGNTRLCTATASFALCETFGNDGNPATVADYDVADCIAHFGHNIAATQTVAWRESSIGAEAQIRPSWSSSTLGKRLPAATAWLLGPPRVEPLFFLFFAGTERQNAVVRNGANVSRPPLAGALNE